MSPKLVFIPSLMLMLLLLQSCENAKTDRPNEASPATANHLPTDWVITETEKREDAEDENLSEPSPSVGENLDEIVQAQNRALESSEPRLSPSLPSNLRESTSNANPPDWVPWHRAYFITDLAVSTSGWLGAILNKGTPSVSLYWRKQYLSARPKFVTEILSDSGTSADLLLSAESKPEEIDNQVEPIVATAMASGKIQTEKEFRENLRAVVSDFRANALALERADCGEWWVARYRLDVTVDGSGKLAAIDLGGDLRVRLEWHRLQKNSAPSKPSPAFAYGVTEHSRVTQQLTEIAEQISRSLEAASREDDLDSVTKHDAHFRAYAYRVGLGLSQEKKVGITKFSLATMGHVQFMRNVPRPVVHPTPLPKTLIGTEAVGPSIPLLLTSADRHRLGNRGDTLSLPEAQFRRGLKKALKMSQFFARHLTPKKQSQWKIFEMRTGLELNLKGKTALPNVRGTASMEIAYFNQDF